ncbi:MAG: glycosyltransferase family 2 protein [Candidatus Binatia bacterium]
MTAPTLLTPAGVVILVLNWNRCDETVACLESLAAADLGGARVFVVDNGSRDGSVATLRARFPDVRVLETGENLGYAGGNNVGMRAALEAGADGVLLLNNDARVARDFLPPLVQALNDTPSAAAVTSAILRHDRPDLLDVAYCEAWFHLRHTVQMQGVNALRGEGYDTRREIQIAAGCSVLMRAEALRRVGLFDEEFFAYHEDVDWCLRARAAGYSVLYEPYSRVYHRGSQSTAARTRPGGAPVAANDGAALPNAEPIPWNPVRTYLGARNTILLQRRYATPKDRRLFWRAVLTEVPLEFLALVMGREGWLRLGRWSYPEMLRFYFVERRWPAAAARRPLDGPTKRRALLWAPFDLLWSLPRDVVLAVRRGRAAELRMYLRGLLDGVLRRPLPLTRLGLR